MCSYVLYTYNLTELYWRHREVTTKMILFQVSGWWIHIIQRIQYIYIYCIYIVSISEFAFEDGPNTGAVTDA